MNDSFYIQRSVLQVMKWQICQFNELAYRCLSLSLFLNTTLKLQLGVYIRDHGGESKLFTKQTMHNHNFFSCELRAPLGQHIGRLSSQRLDQASVDIMVNSQYVNYVSQHASQHVNRIKYSFYARFWTCLGKQGKLGVVGNVLVLMNRHGCVLHEAANQWKARNAG